MKTTTGELFGGYATSAWAEKLEALGSATFFGRGDTHLYRLIQGSAGSAEATWFTWSREDHHFRAWQKHISQFHEAHIYVIYMRYVRYARLLDAHMLVGVQSSAVRTALAWGLREVAVAMASG